METPQLSLGQVLIQVKATSINAIDNKFLRHDVGLNPEAVPTKDTDPPDWVTFSDVSAQAISYVGDSDPLETPNWWYRAPHVRGGQGFISFYTVGVDWYQAAEITGGNHAFVDGHVGWIPKIGLDVVVANAGVWQYWWRGSR